MHPSCSGDGALKSRQPAHAHDTQGTRGRGHRRALPAGGHAWSCGELAGGAGRDAETGECVRVGGACVFLLGGRGQHDTVLSQLEDMHGAAGNLQDELEGMWRQASVYLLVGYVCWGRGARHGIVCSQLEDMHGAARSLQEELEGLQFQASVTV